MSGLSLSIRDHVQRYAAVNSIYFTKIELVKIDENLNDITFKDENGKVRIEIEEKTPTLHQLIIATSVNMGRKS